MVSLIDLFSPQFFALFSHKFKPINFILNPCVIYHHFFAPALNTNILFQHTIYHFDDSHQLEILTTISWGCYWGEITMMISQ